MAQDNDERSDQISPESDYSSDPMAQLPAELTTHIFGYLSAEQLTIASLVSKRWRNLVNTDSLWKKICIRLDLRNENFPYEFGVVSPPAGGWCRWAQIYQTAIHRKLKWELLEHINLCASSVASCFGVHGTTVAVGNCGGGITICSNIGQDIVPVQDIEVMAAVRDISVAVNTVVFLVGEWASILRFVGGKFETEAIFHAETENRLDQLHQLENENSDGRLTKILLITDDFIWFKTSGLKIYCRSTRLFISHEITHITDAKHNQSWVVVLRPSSIDVFKHNGTMEFTVKDESFYTGLVMSHCGAAFLESPDFDDPVAAYLNLSTRGKTVLGSQNSNKLKVYKLALYQDTLFCLNGRERFDLSCHLPSGQIKWIVPLPGSKYLRPGKDFFSVICSKFIFLSPAQVRLDVFDLFDTETGTKLHTVSIHTSSYNICEVSDAGLTIQLNSSRKRNLQGNYISWWSMA